MQREGEERALGNSEATEVLTRAAVIGAKLLKDKWYAWQGSNLRPSVPEDDKTPLQLLAETSKEL